MNNMSSWSVVALAALRAVIGFRVRIRKGRVVDLRPRSHGNNGNAEILRDEDGFSHPDCSKKSDVAELSTRLTGAMTSLDHTLAVLPEPTRHGVIELLRIQRHRVGDLAFEFGISAPGISRHLGVLRVTGLGRRGSEGHQNARLRVYRLRRKPFLELQSWPWRD